MTHSTMFFRMFRDTLIRRFSTDDQNSHRTIKWTILLIWSQIFPLVTKFLRFLNCQTVKNNID